MSDTKVTTEATTDVGASDRKSCDKKAEPGPLPDEKLAGEVPKKDDKARDLGEGSSAGDVALPTLVNDRSGPPPAFAPYEPTFTSTEDGIVTHDAHLNEDGEALYRFLLAQSATPPTFLLHLGGTHTEQRTRRVTARDSDGDTYQKTETYTVTITDFCVDIDLTPALLPMPVQWSVCDGTPAWRGAMEREVDELPPAAPPAELGTDVGKKVAPDVEKGRPPLLVRRPATDEEVDVDKAWRAERHARGLPPWVTRAQAVAGVDAPPLESTRTVRDWADAYCGSNRVLKEFVYKKVVYGWNTAQLIEAIEATVRNAGYHGNTQIYFKTTGHKVTVRPLNRLSLALEKTWVVVLLWLCLVYPFLWLWRRFSSRGGGKWKVCGGAYALKRARADGTVEGLREGEWMRRWEDTIRHVVVSGMQLYLDTLREPLVGTDGVLKTVAALDGY